LADAPWPSPLFAAEASSPAAGFLLFAAPFFVFAVSAAARTEIMQKHTKRTSILRIVTFLLFRDHLPFLGFYRLKLLSNKRRAYHTHNYYKMQDSALQMLTQYAIV
jgi:hypothetical protein